MTDKQRMFAEEYIADPDMNATRAYKKVYKNCKTDEAAAANASRLLKNANVSAYVRELQDKRSERLKYTADDVLKDLIEVKDRCMQAVPVMKWDAEQHAYVASDAEYTFDSKGANAALKLIGDHLGMFKKNVAVDVSTEKRDQEVSNIENLLKQMREVKEDEINSE